MATHALRELVRFWNGSAFHYDGEGRPGIGDEALPASGLGASPTLSAFSQTHILAANPFTLVFDTDTNTPPADETPPTIGTPAPAEGATVDADDVISVDVSDEGLALVFIWAEYDEEDAPELIHDGSDFTPAYMDSTKTPIADGYTFALEAMDGWRNAFIIHVLAIDDAGNSATDSFAYTGPEVLPGGGDAVRPTISNVTPAPGSISYTQSISLDVTDDSGSLAKVLLVIQFTHQDAPELVHDGDVFTAPYQVGSTRTPITNGYRYTLIRNSGWPASFTLTPFALDASGNENL